MRIEIAKDNPRQFFKKPLCGKQSRLKRAGCHHILHLSYGIAFFYAKSSCPCPPQRSHDRAAAQSLANIRNQRAYVCALAAGNFNFRSLLCFAESSYFNGVNRNLFCRAFHFPALARKVIKRPAANFYGGIHGRCLHLHAGKRLCRGAKLFLGNGAGHLRKHLAGDVLCVRCNAKTNGGSIAFIFVLQN